MSWGGTRRAVVALAAAAFLLVALVVLSRRVPLDAPRISGGGDEARCLLVGPLSPDQRQLLFVSSENDRDGWEDPIPVGPEVKAAVVAGGQLHIVTQSGVDLFSRRSEGGDAGAEWRRVPGEPVEAVSFGFDVLSACLVGEDLIILGTKAEGGLFGVSLHSGRLAPIDDLPVVGGPVSAALASSVSGGRLVAWIEADGRGRNRLTWDLDGRGGRVEGVSAGSLSLTTGPDGPAFTIVLEKGRRRVPARVLLDVSARGTLGTITLRSRSGEALEDTLAGVVAARVGGRSVEVVASDSMLVRRFEEQRPGSFIEVPFADAVRGLLVFDLRFVTPMALLVLVGLGVTFSRMARRWRERRRPILFEMNPAPFLHRFAAALVDGALAALVAAATYAVMLCPEERAAAWSLLGPAVRGLASGETSGAASWLQLNVLISLFAYVLVGYHAIAEAAWGRTLGKRLFKMRVMDVRGVRADVGACVARSVLRLVDLAGGGLVGTILILMTRRRRRLGDLLGGTFVAAVHDRGESSGEPVP